MAIAGNGNGWVKLVTVAVITALLSAAVTALFTMSSGNTQRDLNIVRLETTMQDVKDKVNTNHDEQLKQYSEMVTALRQVQIDVARISQKVGVSASPGGAQ